MLDPQTAQMVAAMVGAMSVTAIIYVIVYPYLSGDRARDKRVAGVTSNSATPGNARTAADAAAARRKQIAASVKEMDQARSNQGRATTRVLLERAGFAGDPKPYWIMSGISCVVCAALAYVTMGNTAYGPILVILAAFVGGLGLPRFALAKLITRRQKQFEAQLANALDLIVRGIKSGLPLGECLQIVASEIPGPVGEEFSELVEQQRVGVALGDALQKLAERMPLQDVNFLAIVISIQQQSGGNLAEALSNLSGLLRDRWKMAMRVKALASEAKASAAILGALPPAVTVMLYLSTPDYVAPLFDTRAGNFMLLAGAFWMFCGIMVMRKLINFKI